MVAGPEGRVSVMHGVAAVGNADTENMDATVTVLKWLGSADGQAALAGRGIAFPGAVAAQDALVNYWSERGVDVQVFIEAANGQTIAAPVGPLVGAGANQLTPILQEMFLGNIPVAEALEQAQAAGNEAME